MNPCRPQGLPAAFRLAVYFLRRGTTMTPPHWALLVLWPCVFALAFYTNWQYIDRPFDFQIPGGYTDDRYYLSYGPLTWQRLFTDWLPSSGTMFYRPVFSIWFSGLHRVFGFWSPGFQIADICLHAVTVGLAASLAARLSGRWWLAYAVAAVMLSTSMYSEAVYWASSSAALLAGVWTFAMLHAWLSRRQTDRSGYFWGALACAFLAVGSKQDAAGALLLIPAFDWLLGYRPRWKAYPVLALPLLLNPVSNAAGVGAYSKTASTLTMAERLGAPFEYLERCTFGLFAFHLAPLNLVAFAVSLVILGYPLVVQRETRIGMMALTGCAAFALFAGTLGVVTGKAMPDRYMYLPIPAASLCLAAFPVLLWRGEKSAAKLALSALACKVASGYLPHLLDPCGILGLVLVVALAALILAREGWLPWRVAALIGIVAVVPQLEIYGSIGNLGTLPVWNAVALVAAVAISKSGGRVYALAAAWFLLTSPVTALPVFLMAITLLLTLRARLAASREPVFVHQVRQGDQIFLIGQHAVPNQEFGDVARQPLLQ